MIRVEWLSRVVDDDRLLGVRTTGYGAGCGLAMRCTERAFAHGALRDRWASASGHAVELVQAR